MKLRIRDFDLRNGSELGFGVRRIESRHTQREKVVEETKSFHFGVWGFIVCECECQCVVALLRCVGEGECLLFCHNLLYFNGIYVCMYHLMYVCIFLCMYAFVQHKNNFENYGSHSLYFSYRYNMARLQ